MSGKKTPAFAVGCRLGGGVRGEESPGSPEDPAFSASRLGWAGDTEAFGEGGVFVF